MNVYIVIFFNFEAVNKIIFLFKLTEQTIFQKLLFLQNVNIIFKTNIVLIKKTEKDYIINYNF